MTFIPFFIILKVFSNLEIIFSLKTYWVWTQAQLHITVCITHIIGFHKFPWISQISLAKFITTLPPCLIVVSYDFLPFCCLDMPVMLWLIINCLFNNRCVVFRLRVSWQMPYVQQSEQYKCRKLPNQEKEKKKQKTIQCLCTIPHTTERLWFHPK